MRTLIGAAEPDPQRQLGWIVTPTTTLGRVTATVSVTWTGGMIRDSRFVRGERAREIEGQE